ncbi:uncharacterized protein SETTUDRAFT_27437 [Exserohilum turcica Et28A]|uniref:Uncharacterized protein n=1 Tax=Exserohilum turcicum (strain 28A) TaxID=671987 RepID=R0KL25_EXST2|nr:uncharacterized protein SETTUDRAFT_27437 [Exserohilum turcica Et28A]EOA88637.1 hypothetical protein SETTUDRAFT_27437 [Exserohilum turcica Et28A]
MGHYLNHSYTEHLAAKPEVVPRINRGISTTPQAATFGPVSNKEPSSIQLGKASRTIWPLDDVVATTVSQAQPSRNGLGGR